MWVKGGAVRGEGGFVECRLVLGSPQCRRPAGGARIMKQVCSCQKAITHSLEACIAGGLKKKQGLYRILAVVTQETEPTSMRETNTHVHSCIQTHTGGNEQDTWLNERGRKEGRRGQERTADRKTGKEEQEGGFGTSGGSKGQRRQGRQSRTKETN